jgi:hypothetical protein
MLSFEEEHFYKLEKNKKYYIFGICDFIGTFHGYQNSELAIFRNVYKINKDSHSDCGYVTFSYKLDRHYYKVKSQKEKIQEDMEKRALSKVLKRITGDDLFIW